MASSQRLVQRNSTHRDIRQLKEQAVTSQEKVKGPASYFPSIEKKYGKPVEHWMKVLAGAGPLRHMELVSLLESEHEMGHGHANALVAAFMSKK